MPGQPPDKSGIQPGDSLGKLLGLGASLAVWMAIGVSMGAWLDSKWGLTPWGTISGSLAGIAGCVYSVTRIVKKLE